MADHVWGIGGGAEMMIRDLGIANGHVEFWFRAGSQTWNNQQDWGYDAGWGYVGGVFRLATGGGWHHLGTIHIPTSRNVMMRIIGEGLGWPTTDRMVWISRATAPPGPTMFSAVTIATTGVRVHFGGNGDGGSPIREWQIGYGTDPNYPQHYVGSGGLTDVWGLMSGHWYYFWARGRNDIGWSPWSGRAQAYTWRLPDAPSPVWFERITQNSVRFRFNGGFDGGTPIREWQLAFGTDPNTAQVYRGWSNGTNDEFNLDPGRTYYAWARGRNDVGWGPWSGPTSVTLRAGAIVKNYRTMTIGGVPRQVPFWRRALPYVKVNGVWRLARPYVKHAGVWKETS